MHRVFPFPLLSFSPKPSFLLIPLLLQKKRRKKRQKKGFLLLKHIQWIKKKQKNKDFSQRSRIKKICCSSWRFSMWCRIGKWWHNATAQNKYVVKFPLRLCRWSWIIRADRRREWIDDGSEECCCSGVRCAVDMVINRLSMSWNVDVCEEGRYGND